MSVKSKEPKSAVGNVPCGELRPCENILTQKTLRHCIRQMRLAHVCPLGYTFYQDILGVHLALSFAHSPLCQTFLILGYDPDNYSLNGSLLTI